MAFESPSPRPRAPLTVSVAWRGRVRILRLNRAAILGVCALLPLLGVWYLGATAYYVFHDQLLAALISRQTEIQYAYEDRIAGLRTQLDRQTSRALMERQTLDTAIRDLSSRGERLEARTAILDTLVRNITGKPDAIGARAMLEGAPRRGEPLASPAPDTVPAPPSGLYEVTPALRSEDAPARAGEDHADLAHDPDAARLERKLASIEAAQAATLAELRDPMVRQIANLREALAATRLSPSRWDKTNAEDGGVGGPFVPLPDSYKGNLGFDANLALLQQAVARQQALAAIATRLPLKKPLDGSLEVTSPFGARLDPFYGRAAMHTGVDLMGSRGSEVLATASGIVTVAGPEGGYGNMVEIDHGNGITTRYAHLSSIDVVPHQHVATGARVGLVGATGRATGPHLHYETRVDGEPVDPIRFLQAGNLLYGG